ncbi:YwaF family protein [Mycoplasma leonicaptivi]|uniref:TMEM164 family acyltransferase n=1 Tax=Mycoplasma leonicaptivi TaxID=36742 RepID=UPI000483FCC6|nr:YwaF family protein [Mycoplasma leonicaptivi]
MNTFFTWKINKISFIDSKWMFFLLLSLVFLAMLISWLKKEKIYVFFNQENKKFLFKTVNKVWLFRIIGIITLIFTIIRSVAILYSSYPFKWEAIPMHFCRFLLFVLMLMFIFNKTHIVNRVSIVCFISAFVAFAFANLGVVKEFVEGDIIYNNLVPGTKEYEKAGLNTGYDTILFWDFVIAHAYVFYAPIFMHIVNGKKSKITFVSVFEGIIVLNILSFVVFGLNEMSYQIALNSKTPDKNVIAWGANWFYLGRTGINTLGKFSQWPNNSWSLSLAFMFGIFLVFGILILFNIISKLRIITIQKDSSKQMKFIFIKKPKEVFKEYCAPLKNIFNINKSKYVI